jgi:oxygen-independent coproporphyrinogen III oxidase
VSKSLKDKILSYDRATPRYTSYPPATQFKPDFSSSEHAAVLLAAKEASTISLYIHIPFCAELCYYCGCLTYITNRQDRVERYLAHLIQEAEQLRDLIGSKPKIAHLHFGGGSPTILSPDQFKRLMGKIKGLFTFTQNVEIAIEADPRQLTEDKIKAYASAGINRISFGVQDFDQTVLESVNRHQPFALTQQAVVWCRQYGIHNINFDLMYGLPHQTAETVTQMMAKAISLQPTRFAYFGYAHVPWMKKHMKAMDLAALPAGPARYDLYITGKKLLENAGYTQIGIDHFARSEDEMHASYRTRSIHRNFQGYTTDKSEYLLGLGASSISQTPLGYAQNTPDIAHYEAAVQSGQLPTHKGYGLNDDDRLRAKIIEEIMCYQSLENINIFPKAIITKAKERLMSLIKDGLLDWNENSLKLKGDTELLTRLLASAFDAYTPWIQDQSIEMTARHARTV